MEPQNTRDIRDINNEVNRRRRRKKKGRLGFKVFSILILMVLSGYSGYVFGVYDLTSGYDEIITVDAKEGETIEDYAKAYIRDLSIDIGESMIIKANKYSPDKKDMMLHKGDKVRIPTRGIDSILNGPNKLKGSYQGP